MATSGTSERDGSGALHQLCEADESLHAGFERVAAIHPLHTALISDRWQPTYAELNATANRLAHAIMARGGATGDRVAILMDHDAPAIAAVIAVMKAGRIVVALNPTHPPERLRELIADSEPTVIISDTNLSDLAKSISGPNCTFVRFEDQSDHWPEHNPAIELPPDNVATLAYTSGSTGHPKAVMMTHRSIRRNVMIRTEALQYCAEDRIPLLTSLLGGQGMTTAWCALLNGAALCPFPVIVKGVTGLADWMTRHKATVFPSSASIFRNFMKTLDRDCKLSGVRAVRISSEPATSDDFKLFQQHFPDDCWFVHTLSSSETSNIAWSRRTHHDQVPEGKLPIGAVSQGQEVLLLDANNNPVAAGEVGEIVVRSRYLAAGYWRNPELTAEKFSAELDDRGTRMFRTGDFARFNETGMLEFFGRQDDRVKIRGNRIELSEVESALCRLHDINRAVVEAIARPREEPLLVGFVVPGTENSWSPSELRLALRARLPSSMVPSDFVMLPELPFTPTGKIDREKLRQDYQLRRQRKPRTPPQTKIETLLADIWSEVFELYDIGQDEDFFALGGDSLMAAVVAAMVHDKTGVQLDLATLAEHSTLKGLAAAIDELQRAAERDDEPPLAPVPRTKPLPMSFTQERTWRFSRTPEESAAYTMARIYRIAGPLDPALLRDCINDLANRHEIMRATYCERDGRLLQIVDPSTPLPALQYLDLSGADDPESRANAIFRKEAAHVFDLTRGPLLHFCLIRLRNNEFWLLRTLHHIIADNMSSNLYFDELAALYQAKLRGEAPPPAEPAPLQYGDYAAWQHKVLNREGAAYANSVSWWKVNLSGTPPAFRFSFTRERNASDVKPADGMMSWGVKRQVSHRLNVLSLVQGATRTMTRLAAFAALLAADVGANDVVIGMYTSGRTRLQLQRIFGDFTNLLALRFGYDPSKSFRDWLTMVRDQVLGAEANSAIPYEELNDALRQRGIRPPEIQAIFHVSLPNRVIEFAGLSLSVVDRARQSYPWGFTLDFNDQNEDSGSELLFDPRIYDPDGVRLFAERYERLLDAVSRHPDLALDTLLTMSAADGAGATSPAPAN